jgi:hypothetical protein
MMEKLALPGKGGGMPPPPFTIFTITYKVAVYAPTERADTLTQFYLFYLALMYSVVSPERPITELARHYSSTFFT